VVNLSLLFVFSQWKNHWRITQSGDKLEIKHQESIIFATEKQDFPIMYFDKKAISCYYNMMLKQTSHGFIQF
jgi:hypothetical protein